mgnify:CR=1 FL=1
MTRVAWGAGLTTEAADGTMLDEGVDLGRRRETGIRLVDQ